MPDFVTLSCPSCGARLQVTNDLDSFACGYCGNELRVRRGGGIVALQPVMESLGRIEEGISHVGQGVQHVAAGVDNTASELALQRLEKEIADVQQELSEAPEGGSGCAAAILTVGIFGIFFGFTGAYDSATVQVLALFLVLAVLGGLWHWRSDIAAKNVRAPLLQRIEHLQGERRSHLARVHGETATASK